MSEFSRRSFVATALGAVGVAGLATALPESAQAAIAPRVLSGDNYLRLSGVTGDSAVRGYEGWIPLAKWDWGALSGQAQPFFLATATGKHSAAMLTKAIARTPFDKLEIASTSSGAQSGIERVHITLTSAVITQASMDLASAAADRVEEEWLCPAFASVKFDYRPLTNAGAPGPWQTVTWNINTGIVS